MSEWCWLNGEVLPLSEARVGVEDRGFQFADGVYEAIRLYGGKPFALREHLDRLQKSAGGIQIAFPISIDELANQINKLVAKSEIREGTVYLQLTRGEAPRNHVFPKDLKATLLFYARELPPVPAPGSSPGVKLISVADDRWRRCWIKSIALLPNVLAKNAALAAGADEAVFVENGIVSECSSSNFFAIIDGKLVTHPVGEKVLPGITAMIVTRCARELGIKVVERPLREDEAKSAAEIFITSTTREISWVASWDGREIAHRCGPITLQLHRAFQSEVNSSLS